MKNVLVLNGSPRGVSSRTMKLAEAFLEGFGGEEPARTETVHLRDLKIGLCRGCFSCWARTPGSCVLGDDMAPLLESFSRANLVLFVTPVYHYGMTALLKTFIERLLPLNYPYMVKEGALYRHPQRRDLSGTRYGVVTTCGFPDLDNFRALNVHFEKLFGGRLAFSLACTEGELLAVAELEALAASRLETAREAGRAFAATGTVPESALEALRAPLVPVEGFVGMANASWSVPGEVPPTPAQVRGEAPYRPAIKAGPGRETARGGPSREGSAPAEAVLPSATERPDSSETVPAKERNLMFAAFIPWKFGWFLSAAYPLFGILLPLALSTAFLAYRAARNQATWFEMGTPLGFAALTALAWLTPGVVADYGPILCNVLIGLVWGSSLLAGRPLTSDYSKLGRPASIVKNAVFNRINALLTGFWTLIFLGAAAVWTLVGPKIGLKGWLTFALVYVAAGYFTSRFPKIYLSRIMKGGFS